jgi:hypothetical protein
LPIFPMAFKNLRSFFGALISSISLCLLQIQCNLNHRNEYYCQW